MTGTKNITIAVDGYSSTGKSTIAKAIAKALNYVYIDSGAMYRAVTLWAIRKAYISENEINTKALEQDLSQINLIFKTKSCRSCDLYMNGENIEPYIRSMDVSGQVSKIAALPFVRRFLVEQQQSMQNNTNLVMDGRDIGTVVFPNAQVKLFITADTDIRAQRRYEELLSKGQSITFEAVKENLLERDRIDTTRKDSPLRKAKDAITIDTSYLTPEKQLEKALEIVREKLAKKG